MKEIKLKKETHKNKVDIIECGQYINKMIVKFILEESEE